MKIKKKSQSLGISFSKISSAYFQSLRCTNIRFSLLIYNYKSTVCTMYLRMCKKPFRSTVPIKEGSTVS